MHEFTRRVFADHNRAEAVVLAAEIAELLTRMLSGLGLDTHQGLSLFLSSISESPTPTTHKRLALFSCLPLPLHVFLSSAPSAPTSTRSTGFCVILTGFSS
jgi:hypothetical protein